jgi:hypothetical protein
MAFGRQQQAEPAGDHGRGQPRAMERCDCGKPLGRPRMLPGERGIP